MDKYLPIKTIGEGSFGKAILVQEKTTTKIFLMKTIDIRKIDRNIRVRTHQELEILKALSHQNVVKYRESFLHLEFFKEQILMYGHGVWTLWRSRESNPT